MAEGTRERGDTLRGSLAKLADAMLGLLRTRLELVAVEYTEERDRMKLPDFVGDVKVQNSELVMQQK